MPYDAPDYQHVLWDQGKPYWNTASGGRVYIPPMVAAQERSDPKLMAWAKAKGVSIDYQTDPETGELTVGPGGVTNTAAPSGGIFHQRGEWNQDTGEFDTPLDWGNILSMVVGGAITAGVASALMGGGAAADAAVSTAIETGSVDAGVAAGTAAGGTLASTTIGTGLATLPAGLAPSGAVASALGGGSTLGAAGGTAAAGGGGVGVGETGAVTGLEGSGFGTGAGLGFNAVGGGSTLGTIGKIAGALGNPIGKATSAATTNRQNEARIGQTGQQTYEEALMNRAKLEGDQRSQALKDIYRSSYFKNEKPGPYDTRGLSALSPEYLKSLADLEQQGTARLAAGQEYDTRKMKPLIEKDVPEPGALETAGQWAGPTLSTIAAIAGLF